MLQQVRGKGMPQGMIAYRFIDPGLSDGKLDRFLDAARVYMVTTLDAGARINAPSACRKDILPTPLRWCVRIFPRQCMRQINCPNITSRPSQRWKVLRRFVVSLQAVRLDSNVMPLLTYHK